MRKQLAAASMLLSVASVGLAPSISNASPLFTPFGTFTVSAYNTPDTFSVSAALLPGIPQLIDPALSLTVSIVSGGGANEWLVFNYNTVGGVPLSCGGCYWQVYEVGLPATQPVSIIAAYAQFNTNGTAQVPTSSIFPGYSVEANPVPGESGTGLGVSGISGPLGSGPLPALGTFISAFSDLDNTGINSSTVNGYVEALEFAPTATPLPAALPMFVSGLGAFGLFGWRRKRKAAVIAA
jgi:hypothetical protein